MTNRLKGVTLIETMLYIGLFSIIILLVMNFMLSTQEAISRTETKGLVHRSAQFVVQHITDSFEHTQSINETNSIFDADQGILELNLPSGAGQYTLNNSTLYFNNVPITPNSVSVTTFHLTPTYLNLTDIVGVEIHIELISKNNTSIVESINILQTLR